MLEVEILFLFVVLIFNCVAFFWGGGGAAAIMGNRRNGQLFTGWVGGGGPAYTKGGAALLV